MITVEFVPADIVEERYYASVNSAASLKIKLLHYSDFIFLIISILPGMCMTIVGIGMAGAFIGLLSKKLAGLEALVACQISLLTVIWLNTEFLDPFDRSRNLKYLLGIHK